MTGNGEPAQWLQPPRPRGTPESIAGTLARDLLFLLAIAVYVLVVGQNWGVYAATLMIAAYRQAYAGPRSR